MDMKFIFWNKILQIHKNGKCLLAYIYESYNLLLVHGFHMVIGTRSNGRSENVCVTRASWLFFWVNTAISN